MNNEEEECLLVYDEESVINDLAYLKNFKEHCWLDDSKAFYATINPLDIERCLIILRYWVYGPYDEECYEIHECGLFIDILIINLEIILEKEYNNKIKFE